MKEFIETAPLYQVMAFLFCAVSFRSQIVFGTGRAIRAGVFHKRAHWPLAGQLQRFFDGPLPARGKAALEKYGPVIIPLSFLTIGFQTAVNAGAGLLEMSWRKYTLCMIPGCIAWAFIYAVGGMVVWYAFWALAFANPALALAALAASIAAVYGFMRWRKRAKQGRCPNRVGA